MNRIVHYSPALLNVREHTQCLYIEHTMCLIIIINSLLRRFMNRYAADVCLGFGVLVKDLICLVRNAGESRYYARIL